MTRPVWFSEADVTRLLSAPKLIERLTAAFLDAEAGKLSEPSPLRIDAYELGANYVAFPSYWPAAGVATTKVLSGVLSNPERGLPKIDAMIIVMDAVTGRIRAIMDGKRITAMRTAAATAIACRALGQKPGAVLALIGTGVQMLSHAEALTTDNSFSRILVASANNNLERAQKGAAEVNRLTGQNAEGVSVQTALAQADTIVLTTIAETPVVTIGQTKPDAIIASVGTFYPRAQELDLALVRAADCVMADRVSRLQVEWAGHETALGDKYAGMIDLQKVLAGTVSPPDGGIRVFLSEGRSIEDLVAASLVLEAADAEGYHGLVLP